MTVKTHPTPAGRTKLLLLAVATAGLGGCASVPESGDRVSAVPGTVLYFTRTRAGAEDSFRHKIVSRAGNEVVYHITHETRTPNNDQVRLYGGVFSYAYWRPGQGWAEYRFDRSAVSRLFPYRVGQTSRFPVTFGYAVAKTEAEGRQGWKATERGHMRYTVLRRERITVPAGTFDTVVIKRERRFRQIAPPHRRVAVDRMTWYAPKLGYVVRQTIQTLTRARGKLVPTGPRSVVTLQKIDRPGSR